LVTSQKRNSLRTLKNYKTEGSFTETFLLKSILLQFVQIFFQIKFTNRRFSADFLSTKPETQYNELHYYTRRCHKHRTKFLETKVEWNLESISLHFTLNSLPGAILRLSCNWKFKHTLPSCIRPTISSKHFLV
jgi:hypothetical protein